jgi:hypothetical protein
LGGADLVAHTPEFAAAAGSGPGNEAAVFSAKAMAMTAADILFDEEYARAVKGEYEAYRDRSFRDIPGLPPAYLPFPRDFVEALE